MSTREVLSSIVVCAAIVTACSAAQRSTATPSASPATTTPATASPTAASSIRYVAIGASDTVGVGATDPARGSWPARLASRLPAGSAYVNLGVSGSLAVQAQVEQLPGAVAQRPTIVTIWLAVNDLNATITRTSYRETLAALVDVLVRQTAATVFVGNVPDLRPVPAYAGVDRLMLLAQITAYNEAIAEVAAKHPDRVFVVDLFSGSADLVSNITVARDGFHPSDAGYQLIADRFATAMRAKGVPLRA